MGFRNFVATTLTGLMLSGGSPPSDSLEEKIVERNDLPYPEFKYSYVAEPASAIGRGVASAGVSLNIVRLDADITLESRPYTSGNGVQVLKGRADIDVRVPILGSWKFDVNLASSADENGKPLMSVAYNRGSTDFMNDSTRDLAFKLEEKGLLERPEEVTSLYVDVFDWDKWEIRHTGVRDTVFEMGYNSRCLLTMLMDYSSNIKEKEDISFVNALIAGNRHMLAVYKNEEKDYYRLHVGLKELVNVDGRIVNKQLIKGLNSLDVYISKDEFEENGYVVPFMVEADARVNGRAIRD